MLLNSLLDIFSAMSFCPLLLVYPHGVDRYGNRYRDGRFEELNGYLVLCLVYADDFSFFPFERPSSHFDNITDFQFYLSFLCNQKLFQVFHSYIFVYKPAHMRHTFDTCFYVFGFAFNEYVAAQVFRMENGFYKYILLL